MEDKETEVADQVLNHQASDAVASEVDRLILRIYNSTSLMQYFKGLGQNNGKTELDFLELPDAVIPEVKRLIGPVKDLEVFRYSIKSHPHTGFRFDPTPLAKQDEDRPLPQG